MNEIENYIRSCRKSGIADDVITRELRAAGWSEPSITAAWAAVKSTPPPPPVGELPIPTTQLALPAGSNFFVRFLNSARLYRWFVLGGIVIILLGIGGYVAYAKYMSSPDRIWKIASQKALALKSGHIKVEGSYSETAPEKKAGDGQNDYNDYSELAQFGSITLSVKSEGDFRTTEPADADFSLNSTLGVKLGSFSISFDAETRKIKDNFFYKLNGNPLGGLFGGGSARDSEYEWVKYGLKDKESGGELYGILEEKLNEVQEAYKQAKLIKPVKLLGSETIDGTDTWHYRAELDKEGLGHYLESLGKILGKGEDVQRELNPLIDKLDMHLIEVWIGKYDRQIHQTQIETNFPSIISYMTNSSLSSATSKSRDARRLADARQIMTALELFYNDNGQYPAASTGVPMGGSPAFSTYLRQWPTAPTPPDGQCNATNNNYAYQQIDNGNSYKLTFCLGKATGGYAAGAAIASPAGIQSGDYTQPDESTSKEDVVPDVPFTGTLKLKVNLSNLNGDVKIDEPANVLDLKEKLKSEEEVRNINELRRVITAYKTVYNRLPEDLSDLKNSREGQFYGYIYDDLPRPGITQGECSDISGDFNYAVTSDGNDYIMEFCVTVNTKYYDDYYDEKTLKAGKHRMTSEGIDK